MREKGPQYRSLDEALAGEGLKRENIPVAESFQDIPKPYHEPEASCTLFKIYGGSDWFLYKWRDVQYSSAEEILDEPVVHEGYVLIAEELVPKSEIKI